MAEQKQESMFSGMNIGKAMLALGAVAAVGQAAKHNLALDKKPCMACEKAGYLECTHTKRGRIDLTVPVVMGGISLLKHFTSPVAPVEKPNPILSEAQKVEFTNSQAKTFHASAIEEHRGMLTNAAALMISLLPDSDGALGNGLNKYNQTHLAVYNAMGRPPTKAEGAFVCKCGKEFDVKEDMEICFDGHAVVETKAQELAALPIEALGDRRVIRHLTGEEPIDDKELQKEVNGCMDCAGESNDSGEPTMCDEHRRAVEGRHRTPTHTPDESKVELPARSIVQAIAPRLSNPLESGVDFENGNLRIDDDVYSVTCDGDWTKSISARFGCAQCGSNAVCTASGKRARLKRNITIVRTFVTLYLYGRTQRVARRIVAGSSQSRAEELLRSWVKRAHARITSVRNQSHLTRTQKIGVGVAAGLALAAATYAKRDAIASGADDARKTLAKLRMVTMHRLGNHSVMPISDCPECSATTLTKVAWKSFEQEQDEKAKVLAEAPKAESLPMAAVAAVAGLGLLGAAANVAVGKATVEAIDGHAAAVQYGAKEIAVSVIDAREEFTKKIDLMEKRFAALNATIKKLNESIERTEKEKKELREAAAEAQIIANEAVRDVERHSKGLSKTQRRNQRKQKKKQEESPVPKAEVGHGKWWENWYDGDPVRTGKHVFLEVNGKVREVDYRSDEMAQLLSDADENGARYYEAPDDMWFDGEQFVASAGGDQKWRPFNTASQRQDVLAREIRKGNLKEHNLGWQENSGRFRQGRPLISQIRSRSGVAREAKGGLRPDLPYVNDDPSAAGDEGNARHRVRGEAHLDDADKMSWYECKFCKHEFAIPTEKIKFWRFKSQEEGKTFFEPNRCLQCKKEFADAKALRVSRPNKEATKETLDRRPPVADFPKGASRTEKESVTAELQKEVDRQYSEARKFFIATCLPDVRAESRAIGKGIEKVIPEEEVIVSHANYRRIMAQSFQRAADSTEGRVTAESIQAAHPSISLAPGLSVGRLEFELAKGMSRSVCGALSQYCVAKKHASNSCETAPMFFWGHGFESKKQLRWQDAKEPHGGRELPGFDLLLYPKPQGIKALSLALPKVGELCWRWSADVGKVPTVSGGIVTGSDVKVPYTEGDTGKVWSGDGLWSANYGSGPAVSGAIITNQHGEAIGVHASSSGKPGSPAYFQPMTPELIKILQTPPQPLNSMTGSGISPQRSEEESKRRVPSAAISITPP